MKRDDDLIRDLLLKMEEAEDFMFLSYSTLGASIEERREQFHLKLLSDAGYVLETGRNGGVFRLTNQGCDYLNTIRDGEIWDKTKVVAKGVGGGTFDIIKDIATAFIKAELKARLGLDLG
jgi:hypothetical protein